MSKVKEIVGKLLKKDEQVNLMELDPSLHRVMIGLGWDVPDMDHGYEVDLDASAFLLGRNESVRRDTDFIFYNNLETDNGVIKHLGDNTTGYGQGDDEEIEINLDELSYDIEKITFAVTIHNAEERSQAFGVVTNAFIRVVDADTKEELVRYNLTEEAADSTGFIFGEIDRDGGQWKFKAIGKGVPGGLYRIAHDYKVNVAMS